MNIYYRPLEKKKRKNIGMFIKVPVEVINETVFLIHRQKNIQFEQAFYKSAKSNNQSTLKLVPEECDAIGMGITVIRKKFNFNAVFS